MEQELEEEGEQDRQGLRILIVAAYASVRAGLHALLNDTGDDRVVGTVGGSADLERLLPTIRPDVVLFDDNESDRARVLDILAGGEAGLVMLGDERSGYWALVSRCLHGWAYLLKEAEGPEIVAAAHAAAAGLIVLDRSLVPLSGIPAPADALTEALLPGEALTAREREVLQRMAQGLPNKTIAVNLGISLHTVKFHVASILAKLGASSRTEAVTLGVRRGYVLL